jgi:LPS O-antigen subunit length determinant protein (WzzB/FepE family)
MTKHTYTVYDPSGEIYEHISINAQDDEDAQQQIDTYLNTLQDCYAFEDDDCDSLNEKK